MVEINYNSVFGDYFAIFCIILFSFLLPNYIINTFQIKQQHHCSETKLFSFLDFPLLADVVTAEI